MRLQTEGGMETRQEEERRCILMVDDESVIRELCARVLKGYRVLQATNAEEALGILSRETVDLVLTDVMMPGMNGIDLLKKVKEREPNQVVVVMTGYADKDVILRALKADADDFISKPINLLQLKTTIDKVLEKKALKEELLQLKRMDRLKSDFLGLISHKLKTPTTAISLFIQNLAEGIGDPTDPSFLQTLDLILDESRYLSYLIQDLLFYSEIILQEGPLKPAAVIPWDLAMAVVNNLKEAFSNKGVRLETLPGASQPEMQLDAKLIRFALLALLENALKFTPPGGTVSLSTEGSDQELHLVIRDTGQGIPADELPRVFDKFYQVDPANTGQVRGFGLGLFYARQFMQMHGGTIRLESQPGLGTVATLILPR